MATAREEGNPYENGLGGGGKFRKRPFRRIQATPYDRPPTAIRNPGHSNHSNGWLSKLVDPAQRLITTGAHKLFASVFRKRLPPPPPPQPPEPEANANVGDEDHEVDSILPAKNPSVTQGDNHDCDNANNSSIRDGLTELEQILRQKTFTRSEIDQLTTLLRSRTVDMPAGNEERRSDMIPSKSVVSHDRKEEFPKTQVRENGIQGCLMSTPLASSSILDDDIASPAELAKAYMGSRPSKVSPSMLDSRSKVVRGDSNVLINRPFPPKSPIMSIVARSSSYVGVPENGFITPRSRGRSAIYSMARTPYSRVGSTATSKGAGYATEAFGGPSSSQSQSAWEQNRLSGSKRETLKRRSSVLDNDIGSVGPIRRIRQKPNLLSSKSLSLPAPGSSLSRHAIGVSFAAQDPSTSKTKFLIQGEVQHNFAKSSMENADNSFPGTNFTPVPSKSSEMASKILQQLDKLVSSREKSPTKLSPSMLRGPALKSLENVDSSKFLGNLQDNSKSGDSLDKFLPDTRESASRKQHKVEDNGPKFLIPRDKSDSTVNETETTGLMKDNVASAKAPGSPVLNSVADIPRKNRTAFRMSAHEDYLELDDDDCSNGAVSTPLAEKEKSGMPVMENNKSVAEFIKVEKPPFPEFKPLGSFVLNKKADLGASDGFADAGKSAEVISTAASPSMTVQPVVVAIESISAFPTAASLKESNAALAISSFGEEVPSQKESNGASPTFAFGSKIVDEALPFASASPTPAVSESLGPKFGVSWDPRPEKPSSFAAGAADSLPKVPESDKNADHNSLKVGSFASAVSASQSGSIFSFGVTDNNSGLSNGSLTTSSPSFSSVMPPMTLNYVTSQTCSNSDTSSVATRSSAFPATLATITSASASSSSTLTSPASVPSFSTTPTIFKFGSSASPTISATSGSDLMEAKTKDTGVDNGTSVPFGGASSTITSTGTSIFAGTSSTFGTTGSSLFAAASATLSAGSSTFTGASTAVGSTGSGTFSAPSAVGTTGSSSFSAPSAAGSTGSSTFVVTLGSTGSGTSGGTSSAIGSTGSNIFGGISSTISGTTSIFGGTSSAIASTGNSIFNGTSPIKSAGSSLFGGTSSSTGSGIFGFSAAAPSATTTQAEGANPFMASNSQVSAAGTGGAGSASSIPVQFGSSASSPSFGLAGNTAFSSSSSPFGSSTSGSKLFSSGTTFGLSSASSSEANTISSSSSTTSSVFGPSWQAPISPIFGTTFSSSSTAFSYGASSTSGAASNSAHAPTVFGSSIGASSSSIFFNSAPAAPSSQPVFGNPPGFTFGSAPSGNHDQMNMEDSMAEDTVQASTSTVPVFGQQPIPQPQSSFVFGAAGASGASPFQFGTPQNIPAPQNPSPFQASGSLEFNAGGSFSLGTGGGDKSTRKIVKVKHKQRKK